jgi:hypothetical protein
MNKLSNEQKVFVVTALACFDTPHEVAKALKAEFNVELKPQSIECYDPTKRAGRNAAKKWRALFDQARKDFLENTAQIGVAHRAVRMRKLQRQIDLNEQRGNSAMVAQLLEQAAKEMGDHYTDRRRVEHTGKDGKPLPAPVAPVTIFQLPDNGRE